MKLSCLGLMCVLCLLLGPTIQDASLFAQEDDSAESQPEMRDDGTWIINHPDSRRIFAVQCGLDATLFVLKYFKVEYSLRSVSVGLPLSKAGISLADIQQMLSAHGLKTSAREVETGTQLVIAKSKRS